MQGPSEGWYRDPNDGSFQRYWNGATWTEHRRPLPPVPPRPPTPQVPGAMPFAPLPPSGPTGRWYFVITILSAGLLAAVPFFHAASRLDRPHLRKVGTCMAAGSLLGYAMIVLAPTDADGTATGWLADVAGFLLLAVVVIACVMLIGPRREIYSGSPSPAPLPSRNQAAMAGVAESRRKREEARRLAARDPMLALELGVGRPGRNRNYDDGGLLDLNAATAEQLSAMCELPHGLATEVVQARTAIGRFLHVDDAVVYGNVPEDRAQLLRERGIVIAVP